MKLAVPHFRQQHSYTCLPACVRMVLAYLGKKHNEENLAESLGTVPLWGTRPDRAVAGLEALGYHALWFENATLERLLSLIASDWPVIVLLRAGDLPHGRAGLHAIVVVGIIEQRVVYLDPNHEGELELELPSFLRVWSNLGNQGLVIWV